MKKLITTSIMCTLFMLGMFAGANALSARLTYLTLVRSECDITACSTYYTVSNPDNQNNDLSTFLVANVTTFDGTSKNFTVSVWNGTGWRVVDVSNPKANGQYQNTNVNSYIVSKGTSVSVKVTGTFTPSFDAQKRTHYAIDHVPGYMGYTYPEYDLWNQTWNKCFDVNVTYNLGSYGVVNEPFPLRLNLNWTILNTSQVRNDWGDVRFANGTCGNVSSDYTYQTVYANSTHASFIIDIPAGGIVSNTPTKIAVYYNNTVATHTNSAFNGALFNEFRSYTGDMTSGTSDTFTSSTPLLTYGTSSLFMPVNYYYGNVTQLGASSLLYTRTTAPGATFRGVGTTFKFRLNDVMAQRVPLANMKNSTDTTSTGVFEVYIK